MLGSAEAGAKMLKSLSEFARKTPFELPEVVTAGKQLLAMGSSAEDVIPELKMLGDVSAGLGVPMERLILNFGQVRTQGKLTGRELRDFNIAGVPLMEELAKSFKVTKEEIADMTSAGKIGFEDVKKAFENMTGPGGKFFDLMTRQSRSFGGLLSNLRDNVGRFARMVVGISESGDVREGSIFALLRDGAADLLTYLDANADKITAKAQQIIDKFIDFGKRVKETFARGGAEAVINEWMQGLVTAFITALPNVVATVTGLIVQYADDIIIGFVKGLIQAAKANPLNFTLLFVALGFTPAIVTGALATVLGGIPLVGPIFKWILLGFGKAARLAMPIIKSLFAKLGSTMIGGAVVGFVGGLAAFAGIVFNGIIAPLRRIWDTAKQAWQALKDLLAKGGEVNAKFRGFRSFGPFVVPVPFQHGGLAPAGQPALVGEAGPEVIVPRRDSTVIPNHQLGGSTINFNVNIGMFAGNPMERRQIAETLYRDLADVASARGMSLSKMIARA